MCVCGLCFDRRGSPPFSPTKLQLRVRLVGMHHGGMHDGGMHGGGDFGGGDMGGGDFGGDMGGDMGGE